MHKHNSRHNSIPAEPSHEEIARLAYSFFETEGRLDGHDLEYWLRAKKQLSKSPLVRGQALTRRGARKHANQ
jgi:hypothetical protein